MNLQAILFQHKGEVLDDKNITAILLEMMGQEYGECTHCKHPFTYVLGRITKGCACHNYKEGDYVIYPNE